ncbi:hypothetical protein [Erwinia sp. 9145]|uniref:hypothetical protein n=1 Tax=Erwinia sp. 9145 TaxID=1500895 RepID=UPI000690D2B3|nr:hypothetical protein [Erwinia sp. 9145]
MANYFARWTLVISGLSLGPFVGGALFEWYGKALFCAMALCCPGIAALMLVGKSRTNARLEEQ